MKIYFLRHGLADRSQWEGTDFKRPLTEKGIEQLQQVARVFAGLESEVEYIYTSPLARAEQTAQIIAEALNLVNQMRVDPRLAPGFGMDQLKEMILENASATALLFVGHEPDLSLTIGRLMGGGRIVMKKSSMARVDLTFLPYISGELIWLVTPKVLMGSK